MMKILTTIILLAFIGAIVFITLSDSAGEKQTTLLPKMIIGIASDKIAHFAAFLIFTLILSLYKRFNPQIKWLQRNVVILLIGILFAVGTEALQLLTDTRSFNEYDIFANIYGVVTGLMISKVVFRKRAKRRKTV